MNPKRSALCNREASEREFSTCAGVSNNFPRVRAAKVSSEAKRSEAWSEARKIYHVRVPGLMP